MNAVNNRLRALASWHLPAIAFFVSGLVAGLAFAIAGPVVAVRTLGGLAMASAVFGIVTVGYAARLENPRIFAAWHAAAESLRSAISVRGREWAERVRHVDRYLQNAVWSAMG